MRMGAVKEYEAELDSERRITIKGAKSRKFYVVHDQNGNIILQPRRSGGVRQLAVISARTLKMMDRAMQNFKNGKVSDPVA
jgi:hypothetical protein